MLARPSTGDMTVPVFSRSPLGAPTWRLSQLPSPPPVSCKFPVVLSSQSTPTSCFCPAPRLVVFNDLSVGHGSAVSRRVRHCCIVLKSKCWSRSRKLKRGTSQHSIVVVGDCARSPLSSAMRPWLCALSLLLLKARVCCCICCAMLTACIMLS